MVMNYVLTGKKGRDKDDTWLKYFDAVGGWGAGGQGQAAGEFVRGVFEVACGWQGRLELLGGLCAWLRSR